MKIVLLFVSLFFSGCSTHQGITDAGKVWSMWQYQYQHSHRRIPEERIEGNYKAWGE